MEIRNVWNYNLDSEINNIMNAIDEYSYVSMDTEFPGIVARCMVSKGTHIQPHLSNSNAFLTYTCTHV